MEEFLKIVKDKRHHSSSSLLVDVIEGSRSERKLDVVGSSKRVVTIPECDDHFSLADARCENLKQKINMVKELRKKRKIKKRSLTQLSEQIQSSEDTLSRVRTQPKKKPLTYGSRDHRRNESRAHATPDAALRSSVNEMHEHVRRLNMPPAETNRVSRPFKVSTVPKGSSNDSAQGDITRQSGTRTKSQRMHHEVACGAEETSQQRGQPKTDLNQKKERGALGSRRRYTPRDSLVKDELERPGFGKTAMHKTSHSNPQQPRRGWQNTKMAFNTVSRDISSTSSRGKGADVVEIFSNSQSLVANRRAQSPPLPAPCVAAPAIKKMRNAPNEYFNHEKVPLGRTYREEASYKASSKEVLIRRRSRRRTFRYEMPTVASQAKHNGVRFSRSENSNSINIPFVVSKSTEPSHNIGVNLQQILNGLKNQQPLSRIPLTIAYHMGLKHIPAQTDQKNANCQRNTDMREYNVLEVGQKIVRLPLYKSLSYNKLLALYRQGNGVVQRFLKAMSRPHYFYTSMYDLSANEFDGSTSKALGSNQCQEAKRSLAEYANLYREYEQVEKRIKAQGLENAVPELVQKRDELAQELTDREDLIKQILQDYRSHSETEQGTLHASASNAESYDPSAFKLNLQNTHNKKMYDHKQGSHEKSA